MGAIRCDRNGCNRVMCTHLVGGRYYLCDECLDEFKACVRTWPLTIINHPFTSVDTLISHFMGTTPRTFLSLQASIEAIDKEINGLIHSF
jgi:hypothetical protein